jgi:hypothetical protein
MTVGEKELQNLLSDEAARERGAFKRSTVTIASLGLLSLVWLSFSAYNVVKLERRSANLNGQIERQKEDLKDLQDKTEKAKGALVEANHKLEVAGAALNDATNALTTIKSGKGDPQAQAAKVLPRVAAASRLVPSLKTAASQPAATPSPATEDANQSLPLAQTTILNSPKSASTFSTENGQVVYRGRDGDTLTVQIHYSGQEPRVSYSLDGKKTELKGESFSFTLNKAQHNPSSLVVTLGFDSRGAGYQVKITSSSGAVFKGLLRPTAWFRTDTFVFYVS